MKAAFFMKNGGPEVFQYGDLPDPVFDTVGGDAVKSSFAALRPGGRAAFIGSGPKAPDSPRADVVSLRPNVGRDRAHLERIVELVVSGAVRLPEIKIYSLTEAAEAHRVSEGRHLRGKLVFKVPRRSRAPLRRGFGYNGRAIGPRLRRSIK